MQTEIKRQTKLNVIHWMKKDIDCDWTEEICFYFLISLHHKFYKANIKKI